MSFNDLKKKRGSAGLSAIQEKLESITNNDRKNSREADERFWKPTQGKDGVGSAIIRFLPTTDADEKPWVELTEYSFQGPGGWYIERSLTTIQRKDPVQDKFSELWQTGIEANREKAKKLKRKISYISNILVVKDPANPENEGKVFLFKYGKKIFEKIRNTMFPEADALDDDAKEGVNVFCPWEGANFKLRIAKVDGYPNYDKSEFAAPTALFDGDDTKIKNLYESQHILKDLVAPESFKSYEDLKKRLDRVLGLTLPDSTKSAASIAPGVVTTKKVASKQTVEDLETDSASETTDSSESDSSDGDVDSDLSYLQQLASED